MNGWHLRRLGAMSWPERTLRARRWMRDQRDGRTLERGGPEALGGPLPPADAFLRHLESPWLLDHARWNAISRNWPLLWRDRTEREAEAILAGRFTWLGETRELGACPSWLTEPVSGTAFPADFAARLATRDPEGRFDMKHLWELNTHAAFTTLAKAHLLTGEPRYRERLLHLWNDWMELNPPYRGPNYLAPVEMGRRLLNWGAALRLAGWRTPMEESFLVRVFQHAVHQHRHIARNLSRYSSANNHLLGELASLVIAAGAFPGLATDEARACWDDALREEVLLQFHPDGGNREQALHYHAYSLSWALLAAQVAAEVRSPWPEAVLDRLRRAAGFLDDAMDVRDAPFLYGDSDESEVLPLAEGERHLYRPVVTHAALLLRTRHPKAGTGDERAAWLLGKSALPDGTPAPREPRSAVYPESGHAFLRRGGVEVHVNGGDLGYLSIAAHAHADALSVQVRAWGVPVVVDPGSFTYRGGSAWREWLVSTAAHPTVLVEERDQAERRGPFLWSRPYRGRIVKPPGAAVEALAEHDGYKAIGVRHSRRITLEEGRVVVEDRLDGDTPHRVRLVWPLAPGEAEQLEDGVLWRAGGVTVRLRVPTLPLPARLDRGDPATPGTPCVSPGYDRLVPGWAYRREGILALPARWTTIFEITRREP